MRKFFTVVARIIAGFFAFLFVITAIISVMMVSIENRGFSPELYKKAMSDIQIYQSMPKIIGEMMVSTITSNPCLKNPLILLIPTCSFKSARSSFKAQKVVLMTGGLKISIEIRSSFLMTNVFEKKWESAS